MPIYEYECPEHGRFERTQRITEPALKSCDRCGSKVQRLISHTSFALKGSGWYATDYGSSSSSGSSSKKKESSASSRAA